MPPLLVAAAGSWFAVALLLGGADRSALVVAGIAAAAAAICLRLRVGWLTVLATCVALVSIATFARLHERQSGPLHDAGRARSSATVYGTVVSDPSVVAGRVRGFQRSMDSVVLEVSVRRLSIGSRTYSVRGTIQVTASGAGWEALLPSQRIVLSGRAGSPRPGTPVTASFAARGAPQVVAGPSRVQRIAHRLRAGLAASTADLASKPGGLLPGLVDGDTSRLDTEVKEDFRATSLTHLTAVSGSNVAIVLAAVLGIVGLLGLGPRVRACLALLGLIGFVIVARPSPSVMRAAAMGAVVLLALMVGRPRRSLPALGAAIVALLVHDPDLARSVGFALSSFATAGIVVLTPRIQERLPDSWPEWLRIALAVPLAAQLACAPVIGAVFGTVGLSAIPANLLAAPVIVPATIAGVCAAGLSVIWMPLARLAAELGGYCCGWLVEVADRLAGVRVGAIALPTGWLGALLALLVTVVCAVLLVLRRPRRALLAALLGCSFAGLAVTPHVVTAWPPAGWSFVACDVGQGDALVVRGGSQGDVLIDSGPDPRALRACLHKLGVRRLQRVILTHLHADHVEGLQAVLGHVPVGVVEVGPLKEPSDEWDRVQRWSAGAGVPIIDAQVGERGRAGGSEWEVLGPGRVLRGTDSDPNNSSLVLALRAGSVSILLTGDAEQVSQSALLRQVGTGPIEADVLKVPHHGSANQDAEFLDRVRARITVTSVGHDNPYGHPSAKTLTQVARSGGAVLRTDLDGSVAIVRRGTTVVAVPSRQRHGAAGGAPRLAAGPRPAPLALSLGIRQPDPWWCS